MDTITALTEALEEGLLVEIFTTDGADYSGYEVEQIADGTVAITYGDFEDERDAARVYLQIADIAELDLI